MTSERFDVAVIGGGIIGVATARALMAQGRLSLVLLEAEDRLATHQTGHNSGVIHSGLYYNPGSQKARTCVEGREALYRFCSEHGIAHERCGKIVVATSREEVPLLDELLQRGQANGLHGLRKLTRDEIHELEPHVSGIAGLLVPETGIVDYVHVTLAMAELVRDLGGTILTGARVHDITLASGEIVLDTSRGEVRSRFLVNCGGLQSDRIARLSGIDPGLRIVPFRGEYYELVPEGRFLIQNLVYPVPDPRFPFLGVHFTRTVKGGVEAGPNAVLALKREGYDRSSFSWADVKELVTYRGFWRMAARHWRTGLTEAGRSLSKKAFVSALQRLVPDLRSSDIRTSGAGVRAQAVDPMGRLVDDFRVIEAPDMIHVLNAPSPAATASLSIAKVIAEMGSRNFDCVAQIAT